MSKGGDRNESNRGDGPYGRIRKKFLVEFVTETVLR